MGYNNTGTKWNYELAKERVLKCKTVLQLNRMPTHKELNEFYNNCGLSNKLSKRRDWKRKIMEELKLEMGKSETTLGWKYEELAEKMLIEKGYKIEKMTTGQHFDLLVNGNVKIDVKAGRRWYMDNYQVNSFGINKKYATCDIYMLFVLDDKEEVERLLIIPSNKVKSTTMSIGKDSKYDIWKNKFEVIGKYTEFLNQF